MKNLNGALCLKCARLRLSGQASTGFCRHCAVLNIPHRDLLLERIRTATEHEVLLTSEAVAAEGHHRYKYTGHHLEQVALPRSAHASQS